MKVIVNRCYGGYSISSAAAKRYRELGGVVYLVGENYPDDPAFPKQKESIIRYSPHFPEEHTERLKHRTDKLLIQVIEELGSEISSGVHAKLEVVEIPDNIEWEIEEYDGQEWVSEAHRTW